MKILFKSFSRYAIQPTRNLLPRVEEQFPKRKFKIGKKFYQNNADKF